VPRTEEALDAILRSVLEQGRLGQGGPRDGALPLPPVPLPALPPSAATTVHRVKVSLAGAKPPVWRRLEVPSDLPLSVLHEVLQTAFGWFDCHPHLFETRCGEFGDPAQDDFWSRRADESTAVLAQVAPAARARLGYLYDFGDNWRHDITVEAILPATPGVRYPHCTAVHGAPPDEDCGGMATFNAVAHQEPAPSPITLTQQLAGLAGVVVPA
jgi:hypothetical protein